MREALANFTNFALKKFSTKKGHLKKLPDLAIPEICSNCYKMSRNIFKFILGKFLVIFAKKFVFNNLFTISFQKNIFIKKYLRIIDINITTIIKLNAIQKIKFVFQAKFMSQNFCFVSTRLSLQNI